MALRSREYIYLDMAKKKTKSSYKYYVAFRYIKDLILSGKSNADILIDFNEKHLTEPDVYCTAGGKPLTIGILRNFRRGVEMLVKRQNITTDRFAANIQTIINDAIQWKQTSIGYLWAIEQVKAGKPYKSIVNDFNLRHEQNPDDYSTRSGKPLTDAILSNWIKDAGLGELRPSNCRNLKEWKKTNKGYLWFIEQIEKGVCQEEIIKQFNAMHEIDPQNYSTFLGSGMTEQTFQRWKKEIISRLSN